MAHADNPYLIACRKQVQQHLREHLHRTGRRFTHEHITLHCVAERKIDQLNRLWQAEHKPCHGGLGNGQRQTASNLFNK